MKLRAIVKAVAAAGAVAAFGLGMAEAAPSGKVGGNTVSIKDGYNDDVKSTLSAASKISQDKLSLRVENITNDDLAAIAADFPKVGNLNISSDKIDSIEPLKKVSVGGTLTLSAKNVADLSPLAAYTTLTTVDVNSKQVDNLKWLTPMTSLKYATIYAPKLASIEGIPTAPQLKDLILAGMEIKDLKPLNSLPAIKRLDMRNAKVQDLSPLSSMKTLETISLYGSTSGDLSPLASLPNLRDLDIYATTGIDYNSLTTLTQIKKLGTGMTTMTDLSWVKKTVSLQELRVFAENVTDYSPVVGSSVEKFTIWHMKSPVDVAQLKDATNLKDFTLDGCVKGAPVTNTSAIATMTSLKKFTAKLLDTCDGELDGTFAKGLSKLEELIIDKVPKVTGIENFSNLTSLKKLKIARINQGETVDLSFAGKLKNLTALELVDVKVGGFDAIAGAENLEYLDIAKTEGISSVKALKALPKLRTLVVKKGAFPDDELTGFANPKLKINQR